MQAREQHMAAVHDLVSAWKLESFNASGVPREARENTGSSEELMVEAI